MDIRTMSAEEKPGETPEARPNKNISFIPNPLPVPKRHVKREMGYDHDVTPDKMHYDVELQPGDDFDIE